MKPQLVSAKKPIGDQVIKIILQYQPSNEASTIHLGNEKEGFQEKMTSSWRVMSFFFVVFVLPTLLISVPLYARYQLYPSHNFLTTDGDIFSLHDTVSSFWCQGQTVKVNGSFEAYQTPRAIPGRWSQRREMPVRSTLILQHDDAEEWGFYLVKGSTFTFSSCARWPGASLVVVKGEKNLRKCFYREEKLEDDLNGVESRKAVPTNTPLDHLVHELDRLDDAAENAENSAGEQFDDIELLPMEREDADLPAHSNIVSRNKRQLSPTKASAPPMIPLRTLQHISLGTYQLNETLEVTAGNSSISSSEEFLKQCTSTIASIELNPYPDCRKRVRLSKESPDRWQFKVNESDYYFFIFASDNTLEANILHFRLLLKRATFNVSDHVSYCSNSSECVFNFPFMSPSGVILNVRGDAGEVMELSDLRSYEVKSVCQPRFIVYTVLILMVPFIIVLFAFR